MPGGVPIERLEERLQRQIDALSADLETLGKRTSALERWQAYVLGAFAGVAAIGAVLAKGVAKKMGWE